MPVRRATTVGDYEVARVGLGTNRLTDRPENRDFLRRAVDAGVGFFASPRNPRGHVLVISALADENRETRPDRRCMNLVQVAQLAVSS
jgi:hypothetical protein